ncbi:hypothetical protein PUNSTDRAFT_133654 [Punctularia strigosozonata HHB-11173 SS5]|uniref:uncharacterized protein n=1 Tax=Punctularia strigosozonata (strain HHB-11173) TaxID=741275 RepID=UPI0004418446|nr:uncharacterized protein PUNSTDRAFT_133654 [Punctularia strigosozonata HHB-11173 SS5]EIN09883.1 hypothetical protein PUNSTDRAFT_133654 [Punctularia strigosozonata HHB-11173 SS5]
MRSIPTFARYSSSIQRRLYAVNIGTPTPRLPHKPQLAYDSAGSRAQSQSLQDTPAAFREGRYTMRLIPTFARYSGSIQRRLYAVNIGTPTPPLPHKLQLAHD